MGNPGRLNVAPDTSPGASEAYADVAQQVARHLAKVKAAGSKPVVRSARSKRSAV